MNFGIQAANIFGFLGPDGCGKSITTKVLTVPLPFLKDQASLVGKPANANDLKPLSEPVMSRALSLRGEPAVKRNLRRHALLFHLPPILLPVT